MFFTTEDYRKIHEWLQHNSIKDIDLPNAKDIDGAEYVVLVKDGKNVKVPLHVLLNIEDDDVKKDITETIISYVKPVEEKVESIEDKLNGFSIEALLTQEEYDKMANTLEDKGIYFIYDEDV
jgi:DNA polymerase III epsilon subunit-like protein